MIAGVSSSLDLRRSRPERDIFRQPRDRPAGFTSRAPRA
jgi:hypothetical protein